MLHNAPSLDLASIILFWKKSREIDHVSWIDTELIWNLIFPLNQKFSNKKKMWHIYFFIEENKYNSKYTWEKK